MLLIVAYQAGNTLGRKLLQGEKKVRIYGQEVQVKAEIKAIGSYSAHGDQNKLVEWVKGAKKTPGKIFLTHGEKEGMKALEKRLKKETGAGFLLSIPEDPEISSFSEKGSSMLDLSSGNKILGQLDEFIKNCFEN